MDSHYIDPSIEDSLQSRSRSNSRLCRTASQFRDLNIKSTIASTESGGGTSTEEPSTSTPTFLDPNSHPDSTFTSSPTSEQCPPFPRFSQSDIDEHWPSAAQNRSLTTPLLRLDPAEQLPTDRPSHLHPSISRSSSYPVNMSTVGVQQYDSRFDAGVRQTFTWPSEPYQTAPHQSQTDPLGFDMNDQYLLQQMSPPMGMATLGADDSKFMPMYARSASSSPPQGSLTPEQRELKRQRDHARRDTKERMRRERSTSHPYSQSPRASPEMMSKSLSSDFPGGLAPSPLLSQGSQGSPNLSNISNISSPAYLAPYTPQLDGGDMYGGVFPMVPNEFNGASTYSMPMAYATPGLDSSLQSFIPRPHSLSASSMEQPNVQLMQSIYQNQTPSKMHTHDSGDNVRVVHSRPKPQCWEHGCNGRQFSTFSNLLRHQREKSGAAVKSSCPNCGAEFTRTTARNGHMAHEKCKQRRAT